MGSSLHRPWKLRPSCSRFQLPFTELLARARGAAGGCAQGGGLPAVGGRDCRPVRRPGHSGQLRCRQLPSCRRDALPERLPNRCSSQSSPFSSKIIIYLTLPVVLCWALCVQVTSDITMVIHSVRIRNRYLLCQLYQPGASGALCRPGISIRRCLFASAPEICTAGPNLRQGCWFPAALASSIAAHAPAMRQLKL